MIILALLIRGSMTVSIYYRNLLQKGEDYSGLEFLKIRGLFVRIFLGDHIFLKCHL